MNTKTSALSFTNKKTVLTAPTAAAIATDTTLLSEFMETVGAQNIATWNTYRTAVIMLYQFSESPISELTKQDAQSFVNTLTARYKLPDGDKRKISAATLRTWFYAVRSFCTHAVNFDFIEKNPFDVVKSSKLPSAAKSLGDKVLTAEQVKALRLESRTKQLKSGTKKTPLRHAVICTLAYTGMRVTDLCNLKWENVNFDTKQVIWTAKKTGKTIELTVNKENFWNALDGMGKQKSGFIFTSQMSNGTGKPVTRQQINRIIQSVAIAAGIDKKITAHDFRHTYASLAHSKGATMAQIRDNLGHSSTQITSMYTHVVSEGSAADFLDY